MKVFVLGNALKAGVTAEVERQLPFLRAQAEVLVVDLQQVVDLSALPAPDLALVFGGDGAILRAAHQMGYRQFPVLGINLGRLGFLADVPPQDLPTSFTQVVRGNARITRHLMYECLITDAQTGQVQTFLGLNEIVIHTTPPFHMLDLELDVDGAPMSRFGGDGLIISTPIGSTAHNLSAGGPILAQELSAFAITPICPHTLTYRPIVESADRTYAIRIGPGSDDAQVVIDGQTALPLTNHHQVIVRKAPVSFALVKVPQRSYYQTLHDKLRWGTPPVYRGEP